MKKIFSLLALILCCMGAWAQTLPFQTSTSKDAADAKWYVLQFRNKNGNTSAYVANNQATQLGQDAQNAIFPNNIDNYSFCFVASGEGYHIYNKATGKAVYVDAVTDRAPVKVGTTPTLIKYRANGSDHFLYDAQFANPVSEHNTLASWSNQDAFIAISASGKRTNYEASRMVYTLVECDAYTLAVTGDDAGNGRLVINGTEYKNGATINWPRCRTINTNLMSAKAVTGCLANVALNTSDKTITVTYTAGYNVTYNITATDVNGENQISFTHTKRELLNATPSLDLDYFTNISVTNSANVDADHTSFNVTATYNYPMMPGKFYYMKATSRHGTKYVSYVSDTEANCNTDKVANDSKYLWYVVSKGDNTFWLCNVEKEKAVVGTTSGNNASVNFADASGSTVAYEVVKSNDTQFRLYWPNSNDNLGAHGNSNNEANAALGKWPSGRAAGNGTNFSVEEFDESVLEITNGTEGLVGYSTNFGDFTTAKNTYNSNKTAANLKSALAAKAGLTRIEIEEDKYYQITFTRSPRVMGNFGAWAGTTGTVAEDAASRYVTTDVAATANVPASLWQFENDANGKYLKSVQSGFYLGNVDNGHLVTTKEKQYGKVFVLSNGNNNLTTWQMTEYNLIGQNTVNMIYNPGGSNYSVELCYWNANDAGDYFTIKEVTAIPVTIASVGYSTICFPVPVTIPNDVTAYKVTEDNGEKMMLEAVSGSIAAGTALIIEKQNGGDVSFEIVASGDDISSTNVLKGATVRRQGFTTDSFYALAADDDATIGVSFKKNGDAVTAVPANKAYLEVSAGGSNKALYFDFGGNTTGITTVETLEPATDALYNLNGQRVAVPTRGIYVKANGQKVFIK